MTTKTRTTPAVAGPDTSPDPEATGDGRDAEIAELRRQLAAARKAAEPPPPAEPKPAPLTHVHVLANGEQVETATPVATAHYSERDRRTIPVISTFELREED